MKKLASMALLAVTAMVLSGCCCDYDPCCDPCPKPCCPEPYCEKPCPPQPCCQPSCQVVAPRDACCY